MYIVLTITVVAVVTIITMLLRRKPAPVQPEPTLLSPTPFPVVVPVFERTVVFTPEPPSPPDPIQTIKALPRFTLDAAFEDAKNYILRQVKKTQNIRLRVTFIDLYNTEIVHKYNPSTIPEFGKFRDLMKTRITPQTRYLRLIKGSSPLCYVLGPLLLELHVPEVVVNEEPKETSPCGATGVFREFILQELSKTGRKTSELIAMAPLVVPQLCQDKTLCAHSAKHSVSRTYRWQHSLCFDQQRMREEGLIYHNGARPAIWFVTNGYAVPPAPEPDSVIQVQPVPMPEIVTEPIVVPAPTPVISFVPPAPEPRVYGKPRRDLTQVTLGPHYTTDIPLEDDDSFIRVGTHTTRTYLRTAHNGRSKESIISTLATKGLSAPQVERVLTYMVQRREVAVKSDQYWLVG